MHKIQRILASCGMIVRRRASASLRRLARRYPRLARPAWQFVKLIWWLVNVTVEVRLRARPSALARVRIPTSLPTDLDQPRDVESEDSLSVPLIADPKDVLREQLQAELHQFLESGERIILPEFCTPDISVLIILYNKAFFTLRCVKELSAQRGVSIELILVDNSSSDETASLLSRIENARVLTNTENQGFVYATNQAAKIAQGGALLMLNNDAFPRPEALAAALRTLRSDRSIGAVSGKLIHPSGKLQEAGSIIWNDGSSMGYARGLPPWSAEATFRRDVDYGSGAFLMSPRDVFERLEGLDIRYAPAYYEEADYCLRLREHGLRVVYEPEAVIDHFEFGSETKRDETGALMLRNRRVFRMRHFAALAREQLPSGESNILFARHAARSQRRLLMIDNEVPYRALGSGYPRAQEILNEASALGWFVTFYPMHGIEVDMTAAYMELDRRIEICDKRGIHELASFFSDRIGFYDTVMVSRPDNMALFWQAIADRPHVLHGVKVIYDAEALVANRELVQRVLTGEMMPAMKAETLISEEVALAVGCNVVIAVSEAEAEPFRRRGFSSTYVLSHSVKSRPNLIPFSDRKGFLFVGRLLEKSAPNYDGMRWFIQEVWPKLRDRLGGVHLTVVGALHEDASELYAAGVRLLGKVESLEPHYDEARVFIAPTRFAAGIPIKVMEASAEGLPVVATPLIADQLKWVDKEDILVGGDSEAFVEACVALYEDADLWSRVRHGALEQIQRGHSHTEFVKTLRAILEEECV
jgi:GT2 family glycosyltransferase